MKTWNHRFDLHKVPAIPEAKLPPKPNVHRTQSISDFLQENDIRNQTVAEVLKNTIQKTAPQISKDAGLASNNAQPKHSSGLSEQLLKIGNIFYICFCDLTIYMVE